jgi:uncharacterized membrane protein (DUF2068 family)
LPEPAIGLQVQGKSRSLGLLLTMAHLSPVEIANWIAIYLAAGMCCAIAMVMSVSVAAHGVWRERAWQEARTLRGAALFMPKLWWRWQKLYFLSTPVTLGIVCYFAATLRWN